MYELEGEREFCPFSSLSVEITSCSFFFYSTNLALFGGKKLSPIPDATNRYSEIRVQENRGLFLLKLNAPTL